MSLSVYRCECGLTWNFWYKIYRKAALKLVQDLGEDAFRESKQAALATLDDASSRTTAADSTPENSAPVSELVVDTLLPSLWLPASAGPVWGQGRRLLEYCPKPENAVFLKWSLSQCMLVSTTTINIGYHLSRDTCFLSRVLRLSIFEMHYPFPR